MGSQDGRQADFQTISIFLFDRYSKKNLEIA